MQSDSSNHRDGSVDDREPVEQPALTRRQLLGLGAGAVGTAAGAHMLSTAKAAPARQATASAVRTGAVDAPLSGASMTITGSTQGGFAGDKKGSKIIAIKGLSFNTTVPYDASKGVVTGRRQHQPLTVTKALGASSPQIFLAASTGEVLTSVVINLLKPISGAEKPYFRITLTNAIIVNHTAYTSDTEASHMAAFGLQELEDVSFLFESILMTDLLANTTGSDSSSVG